MILVYAEEAERLIAYENGRWTAYAEYPLLFEQELDEAIGEIQKQPYRPVYVTSSRRSHLREIDLSARVRVASRRASAVQDFPGRDCVPATLTVTIACRSVFGSGTTVMANAAKATQLPADLQAFAEGRVLAGEYASVDEVASAALRLLRRREEQRAEVREELNGIFREMDGGKLVEPTDEEFANAVRERAAKHQRG